MPRHSMRLYGVLSILLATALLLGTGVGLALAVPAVTLSFNSNGGSAVASQILPVGSLAAMPAAPHRPNYTFAGWYAKPWPSMIKYYARTNYGGEFTRSVTPFTSGDSRQSISGNAITMSIVAGSGYADSGVVFYDGKLGNLPDFTLNGTGSDYVVNLYFDVDGNGEFFTWTGDVFSATGADEFASHVPLYNGTATVNGSTTFDMQTAPAATLTLAQLKAGTRSGITANTHVAVYVGVVSMTGTAMSATITPATEFPWDFTAQHVVGNTTLDAMWTAKPATSINIHTSATSVRRGRTFILSGLVTPQSLIGTNIQVMVKKPGRAYYSYSSLRTVYSSAATGGLASWWYRYSARTSMAAGTYRFYAIVPESASRASSISGTVAVSIR